MAVFASITSGTSGRDANDARGLDRRKLLASAAGAVALAVTVAAVATPETLAIADPDAELIGACQAFIAMEASGRVRLDNDDYPDWPPAYDELIEVVTETSALTAAGNRAKLAVAVAFFGPEGPDDSSVVDQLLWDAVRGLALPLAGGTADVIRPEHADARLIELCADLVVYEAHIHSIESDRDEALFDEALAREATYVDLICSLPATTSQGRLARAKALDALDSSLKEDDPDNYSDDRMIAAVLRDALGRTA